FGTRIQCRCWFVQNQYRRVFQERPRNRESLLFAPRQGSASFANDRVIAIRQTLNELVGVRRYCSRDYVVARGLGPAVSDVVGNRHGEDERLLQNERDLLP